MTDREERQKKFIDFGERISYLMGGMPFFFADEAADLEKIGSGFHEVSRLAMAAAKLAEESAREARTRVPALEPD